jgi:hypothetical protein
VYPANAIANIFLRSKNRAPDDADIIFDLSFSSPFAKLAAIPLSSLYPLRRQRVNLVIVEIVSGIDERKALVNTK